MTRNRGARNRNHLAGDRGEVSSWLILGAGLALAAVLASTSLGGIVAQLVGRVGDAAEVAVDIGDIGEPGPSLPSGPAIPPEPVPPGSAPPEPTEPESPSGPVPPGSSGPELPSGPVPPTPAEPPAPVPPPGQSEESDDAVENITEILDDGDDFDVSEDDLDDIQDYLESLTDEEVAYVFASMSENQLAVLFNNVHSSGFFSDDWNDSERAAFYVQVERAGGLTAIFAPHTDADQVLGGLDAETRRRIVQYQPDVYLDSPVIQDAIADAWTDSNPGSGPDPDRAEQGGWIVLADDGTVSVVPYPPGEGSSISIPEAPDNALGRYHTHPNIGTDPVSGGEWDERPSPSDIANVGRIPGHPSYVVGENSIWVVNTDGTVDELRPR